VEEKITVKVNTEKKEESGSANELLFSALRAVDDFEKGTSPDLEMSHYLYFLNNMASNVLELCKKMEDIENFSVNFARGIETFIRLTLSITHNLNGDKKDIIKLCKYIARLGSTIIENHDETIVEKFTLLIRTCLIKVVDYGKQSSTMKTRDDERNDILKK